MKSISTLAIIISLLFISCEDNKEEKAIKNDANIIDLCSSIKKDTVYKIKDIFYNPEDSTLNIAIPKTKELSTVYYFEKNYNTNVFTNIDGVVMYYYKGIPLKSGKYNKIVDVSSKRADNLVEYFKDTYCTLSYCSPLKIYISQTMNDPDSFEPVSVKVAWNMQNPKTLIVDQTFRGKNAFGGVITESGEAIMDKTGAVLSYNRVE